MTHHVHEFCKANFSIHEIGHINGMDGSHHWIHIGQLDLRRYYIVRCHRNPIATIWVFHQPNIVWISVRYTLFWWHLYNGDTVILVTSWYWWHRGIGDSDIGDIVILVTSWYWWQWYWWHRDIGDSDIGDSDIGDIVILVTVILVTSWYWWQSY